MFNRASCFDISDFRHANTRDARFERVMKNVTCFACWKFESVLCFHGKSQTVKYHIMLTDIYISLCQLLIISQHLLLIAQTCKMKTLSFFRVVHQQVTVANCLLPEFESISNFFFAKTIFTIYRT